jgi:hypothetical protein
MIQNTSRLFNTHIDEGDWRNELRRKRRRRRRTRRTSSRKRRRRIRRKENENLTILPQ